MTEQLKMNKHFYPAACGRQRKQRMRNMHTLRAQVPINWLMAAARLPGKSLHTGLAIWLATTRSEEKTTSLTNIDASGFGTNRNAKYRALTWLERAKLITVERKAGRPPRIHIIENQKPQ